MWSSAMLKEMFRELTRGAIKAISKMSDVSCVMCHVSCVMLHMSVWTQLVYIKQFQIFGYVNKRFTRYVWLDTSNCLC